VNELLFLSQILFSLLFTLAALRLGKEALIASAALQALFANLFLLKQVVLFGFEVTASDAFAVGSMLTLNLLREFHGKESAVRCTHISFFCLLAFALFSELHLLYVPSPGDTAHGAYAALYAPAPRLFFSSLLTFWLVQRVDLWLFGKLPRLWSFGWRNALSLTISLALDTLLFTFAGLYGLVPSIGDVLVFSFCVKALVLFALLSFTPFFKDADAAI
jgi:queuosine precursor transporter